MKIFLSIAAYRDPELLPTILDCVSKADRPEDLRFGICEQIGDEDRPLVLPQGICAKSLIVNWRESRGVCWARAEIMKLWAGEEYYFQIDSHHRFANSWDTKLIMQFHLAASAKAILSTYAPAYFPDQELTLADSPTRMDLDVITEHSIPLFRPSFVSACRPVKARFVSAHFLFSEGSFVRDVPYDPNLYFIGEEISLAVRAFTNGYDLFHPSDVIVWHEYTRSLRTRHWDDHVESQRVEIAWHERDLVSLARVRLLLTTGDTGSFGCGTVRTLREYEQYAGIDFTRRLAQDYTWTGSEPPNPAPRGNWLPARRSWHIRVAVPRERLSSLALEGANFWYVGVHDVNGREIYRQDATREEIASLAQAESEAIEIERVFESTVEPASWTIWPFSAAGGWLAKIEGAILSRNPALMKGE